MNLKKIIKEEIDDFDWALDIPSVNLPDLGRDGIVVKFCNYDVTDESPLWDKLTRLIELVEYHHGDRLNRSNLRHFGSTRIVDTIKPQTDTPFVIYVQVRYSDDEVMIGWDLCTTLEQEGTSMPRYDIDDIL